MTRLVLICILAVLTLTNAAPQDFTCSGIARRKLYNMENCTFVSENLTDIECTSFMTTSMHPSATKAKLRTVFYLKEQISTMLDREVYQYCLGVKSSQLQRVDKLPEGDTSNVFLLPSILESFISPIKGFSTNVAYNGNASVGFLKLNDECDAAVPPLKTSCISNLKAATFIIAPGDDDFTILDYASSKVSETYFTKMNASLIDASFKSNSNTVTLWLPALAVTHVRKFDSSGSDFTGNLPYVFQGVNELKDLNLSNCKITNIDKQNFEIGAPNLEVLDLSENSLEAPPEGLSSLKSLKTLDLSKQDVEIFNLSLALRNLTKLRVLNLSGLPLFSISRSFLPNSPALETLDLSNCSLTKLPDDTFDDLPSLKHLILSGNQLTEIPYKIFQYMVPNSQVQLNQTKIVKKQKLLLNKNVDIVGVSVERVDNKSGGVSSRSLDTQGGQLGNGENKIVATQIIVLLVALNLLKLII